MAVEKLPENVRVPAVARAMFSPSAILAAGTGASVAILAGLWPLAPVAAIVGWAARVAMAIPRKGGGEAIKPNKLPEPWRSLVLDAIQAQRQFHEVVTRVPAGPLRMELEGLKSRVADAVREGWDIAQKGVALDRGRQGLNLGHVHAERERLLTERKLREQHEIDLTAIDRAISAVDAQLAAGQRVETVAFQARDRLRLLNAQLDEAVANVVEISVRPGSTSAAGLGDQVGAIVDDLTNLKAALDEAGEAAQVTTPQ